MPTPPRWDGNNNLAAAPIGQRVRQVGDVFTMALTQGAVRENHVVEFEEVRADGDITHVTHTYDWTQLTDHTRLATTRAISEERLRASLDRLAALAEQR